MKIMKFLENPDVFDILCKWQSLEEKRVEDALKKAKTKIITVDLTDMPADCYAILHGNSWRKEVKTKIDELEKVFAKHESAVEKILAKSNEETGAAKNKFLNEIKKLKKVMRELDVEIKHYTAIYRTF